MPTLIFLSKTGIHWLKQMNKDHTQYQEDVYPYISLDGYKVFGMCQHKGDLDYLVTLHEISNEIRVIRLYYDLARSTAFIKDWKVLDKEPELLLQGSIYVDCQRTGEFKGVNTYTIGVLGSYYHSNAIGSYYFAKFSTKYNLTEYFIKSEDPTVMEIPRRVRVDVDNQRIYIAIEINKNKYHGRTVYQPGELPGLDNSNIAIVGYSWHYGTRLWVTLIGDKTYLDSFADMEYYGNSLYVVTNSFTTTYTSNSSQTDIIYARMRSENGYIEYQQVYGSPSDDKAMDLIVNYNGIYLLALISNPFLPHRDIDKQWKTHNSKTNLAIIQFSFDDLILEIEGYDLSIPSTPNPYPTRMYIYRNDSSTKQNYMFISHRTNNAVDSKGGLFMTYITNQASLYSTSTGCGVGCSRCSSKRSSTKCLECSTGFYLYQHQCIWGSCPVYTFEETDENNNGLLYCKDCHYSCKTCSGPREDQCATCCMNAVCGSNLDRVPSLGKCTCPVGQTEANGICGFQCPVNLGARLDDMCYTQCPLNSYPDLIYDINPAQERTEYNPALDGSCLVYSNHLKFFQTGKGIPVKGPEILESFPKEFTVGLWVMPNILNTNSYFINLFGRAQIYAQFASSKVFYKFVTGAATSIQPTYTATLADQQLALGQWNYISVAQREIVINNVNYYEIQLGIAQGNFATLSNAAYSNNLPVIKYSFFINTIYLGAFTDQSPMSFAGYMKEVRLFTKYHGIYQMRDEGQRLYRLYSYDDPELVAYWKLTDNYLATDIEYTIKDLSQFQNSISYSIQSKPDYPVYINDTFKTLSLCYYHDVKTCRTLDYFKMPPIAPSNQRYLAPPTFDLDDWTLTSVTGDQILYMPNNTDCSNMSTAQAKINFTTTIGWEVKDDLFNPLYLKEGKHYQLCYFIAKYQKSFNMAQIYVAFRPRTVDPSNGHIYNRTDNAMQWMTGWGDQAYGDIIRFSYDCLNPIFNETEITRSNVPNYQKVIIFGGFNITGDFYFCWYPLFIQDILPYPIYEPIHNLKYLVQYEPVLKTTFRTISSVNEDMVMLDIRGTFIDGDQFAVAWRGYSYSDCNPINFLGSFYTFNHSSWPGIWMGHSTGISGINDTKMDELQFCWKPGSDLAPNVFIRIKKEDLTQYIMRLMNYNTIQNQRCPELLSFDPIYGSATLTEQDRIVRFNFKTQQVIPCSNGAGVKGKIIIYRGAVKEDGTFIKTNQILWSNTNLDETTLPDPFQQGDLICTQTGQCSIILSQDTNRMKAGEIYFLTFYSYSFLTYFGSTKYYLFNTAYPVGTPAYDHLFMCRSFNIYPSNSLVNGNSIEVKGLDLKSKSIKAKYIGGNLATDLFITKAINIRFKVYNTDNYFCTFNRPTGTVAMEDVLQDKFLIRNLELRQCNNGDLFADIEMIRGIRDSYGYFTYIRSEKMYNIQLGTIGCDSSCSICNGTFDSNCQVCSNITHYLYYGVCYEKCPSKAPNIDSYSITFQSLSVSQQICLEECPLGYYSDPETQHCVACNPDCQTCNSSIIASCLSCNPVKQLINGICVQSCPSPHHSNNYTSYECNELSKSIHLQVKIQSLGFINRIPKDQPTYLKADINNTGGGNITSILWEQIEPDPQSSPDAYVFSNDTDGTSDKTSPIVKLNNNALMKISFTQVVKVQITVTNSIGEVSYDLYEFYLNDSPFVGDLNISKVNAAEEDSGTSIDTLWRIDLTKWYDSPDDAFQKLKLKVYAVKTFRVGQGIQTQQYTLTDQGNQSTIYVRLPPFSMDQTLVRYYEENGLTVPQELFYNNISICVQAIDQYNAATSKCKDFNNVKTNFDFIKSYSVVGDYINDLDLTSITDILFASNIIYQSIQPPKRPNSQHGICTLDFHCNYRGQCSSKTGIQKCYCDQSYFGTYCDFQGNELQNLRNIVSKMIDSVQTQLENKFELKAFDIEVIANVVRGVTNNQDLVNDETFQGIISLLEMISTASFYAHKPLDYNSTLILYEAYSNAFQKINHSFKLRKTMRDTLLLGKGLTLIQFQGSFQILSNLDDLSEIFSKKYFISDEDKPYLIGGLVDSKSRRLFLTEGELNMYEDWARRIDDSINSVIKHSLMKLDPLNPSFMTRTRSFDLLLSHKKSNLFIGRSYIKSKDAYWNIPSDIWTDSQGVASKKHSIRQKLMKYIVNPFTFEKNPNAFLESNITSVEFYSLANERIPVLLTGSTSVDYREPFNKSLGFQSESLRCMAWDEEFNQFKNDGTCTYQTIWEIIPCADCDQYNQINTTVSICRCKHLSRFGVVYQKTVPTNSKGGSSPGIYSNFFAMQYWNTSFGFYVSLVGLGCFVAGHIFIWFVDRRLQRNLIVQMREKVRRFELQHGALMYRKDGLFFRQENPNKSTGRGARIASKKKVYIPKENQDEVEGLIESKRPGSAGNEGDVPEEFKEPGDFKKSRNVALSKKFDDDYDDLDDDGPVREMDAYQQPGKKRKGRKRRGSGENMRLGEDFDENDKIIMKKLEAENRRKILKKRYKDELQYAEEEEEFQRDLSKLTEEQKVQYERTKAVIQNMKRDIPPALLYHEIMALKYDDVRGMTKKEFRRKFIPLTRKLVLEQQGGVKDYLNELRLQLNSTDEEMYQNMKDIFDQMREERERNLFKLKNMVVNGSYILSILQVTSLLSPRHIRWSLFFCNVVMLWFICAVFFNNTKDPLAVPDFSTNASSLAFNDIWISFVAPWGSIILMYVVASFLKMPNSQLLNVVTLRQLEAALIEYRKESGIRFLMGYIIVVVIMGTIFWYVIQFTAAFGWKVSWVWFYSGIGAIFFQMVFIDQLFSIGHWGVYKLHPRSGRICQRIRSVTQAYNELFLNSEDEEERKKNDNKNKKTFEELQQKDGSSTDNSKGKSDGQTGSNDPENKNPVTGKKKKPNLGKKIKPKIQ